MEENKLDRVAALAQVDEVELMTHPINQREQAYLMSDECSEVLWNLAGGRHRTDHFPSPAVYPVVSDC